MSRTIQYIMKLNQRTVKTVSVKKYPPEGTSPPKRLIRFHSGLEFSESNLSLVAHRELVTTLGTPPGKHLASVLRRHARTKTVGVTAFTFVGLECYRHLFANAPLV